METIILFIKTTIKGSKSLLQVAKTTHHNNKKTELFDCVWRPADRLLHQCNSTAY